MMRMSREEILTRAKAIVSGDRDKKYGAPEDCFTKIAELWGTYLETNIGAEDVAIMMILMKIARLAGSKYQSLDSWVDIAGYAACGGETSYAE